MEIKSLMEGIEEEEEEEAGSVGYNKIKWQYLEEEFCIASAPICIQRDHGKEDAH